MSENRSRIGFQSGQQALPLKVNQASRQAPPGDSTKKGTVTLEKRSDSQSQRSARSYRSDNSHRSASNNKQEQNYRYRCDDCVNHQTEAIHKQNRLQDKLNDIEFYKRVYNIDAKIVNAEQEAEARKLRNFQDARDQLLQNRRQERQAKLAEEEAQKQQLYAQCNDRSDLIRKAQEQQEKLNNHMKGMDKHYNEVVQRKHMGKLEERAHAKVEHNLLIDDGWRAEHNKALKNYYGERLEAQVHETRANRAQNYTQEREADRRDLVSMLRRQQEERNKEAQLREDQKRLFNLENAKAVQGKQLNYQNELADRQATRDLIQTNAKNFEEASLLNREKRHQLEQEVANGNLARKGERRVKEYEEKIEDRKYLTGLHVPQRAVEIHECDDCHQMKDVRKQNRIYA